MNQRKVEVVLFCETKDYIYKLLTKPTWRIVIDSAAARYMTLSSRESSDVVHHRSKISASALYRLSAGGDQWPPWRSHTAGRKTHGLSLTRPAWRESGKPRPVAGRVSMEADRSLVPDAGTAQLTLMPTFCGGVAASSAAGAPEDVLPRRVYRGRRDARRPVLRVQAAARPRRRAGDVRVAQAEDVTAGAVRAWGETHAGLWAALRDAGRAVDVIVVGRDPVRLAAAQRVLDGWTRAPAASQPRVDAATRDARAELAAIRTALAAG